MSERDELRALLAASASWPGRWHWAGNTDLHRVTLSTWAPGYGRVTVLGCRRAGMHGAEFEFCDPDTMMLTRVRDLVVYEVCPAATRPDDPRVYRRDVSDVAHPDARLIVGAVNALPDLLDQLDAAEAEVKRLREGIEALADELDSVDAVLTRESSGSTATATMLGREAMRYLRRLLDGGAS